MSGSVREALGDVREWSGDPLGCPGVVVRPSGMSASGRMSESGVEALGDVWEWSGVAP